MIKIIITTLLTLIIVLSADGQRRRSTTVRELRIEEVPRKPIDTVQTVDPETKIIMFSNNTWEFYRPNMERFDDLLVYRNNWDTMSIFAYRNIELKDLQEVMQLKLIDSLSEFCPPIVGRVLSKYGPRRRRNHNGVDIPLRVGEPILASFDGKVRYAKYNSGGYGFLVILRHKNGLETWHAHLSRLNVKPGDYVKAGQVIGFGGNTGRSRGPHLHFEMRYADQSFDPEFVVDFENGLIRYQTFALERSFFNIHSRASEILEEEDDDYDMPASSLLTDAADGDVGIRVMEPKKESQAKAAVDTNGTVYHTIKSGDMLGKLAVKYGVSVDQICRLNNITRTTTLQLGRKLKIK